MINFKSFDVGTLWV